MAIKRGFEGKLYRNTGTHESPAWDEVPLIGDLTQSIEKGEADVTTRANGGFKAVIGTQIDAGIEFQMPWDSADEDLAALKDAFFNRTPIEFAIMDGDIGAAGAQGLRATMEVMKFERAEPLDDKMMVDIAIKPTLSANAPEWLET